MNFNNKGHKVQSLNQGISLIMRHRTIINEASLALTYWQQRIKERHLQLGDIPSKFLFNRLRQKKQQNYVFMLRNSSGDWVDNPPKIAQMLQSYFKDIYRAVDRDPFQNVQHGEEIDLVLRELHLPRISEMESQMLLAPITDQETRDAVFDMKNDKSPGIDGVPSEFFKVHWDYIFCHMYERSNVSLLLVIY